MRDMRDASDPKHLIHEAYRIDGIDASQCRSIFVDWALSLSDPDPAPHLRLLLARHGDTHPDHPMTKVLREGLETPPAKGRRGGRAGRL
ncbi:MAG: hypothetical protein CL945_11845 [Dinoroseobacter sp.]|jgi:hypothetical protein|nr:hypothetical protein [Dinoroseobacter sp.]|tara:strand:- start:457 stop:723 length:267 start_codon:yes stop_codon:yes gene_type:complete